MNSSNDPLKNHLVNGRYRLLARIGQGGMGTVYRAQDEFLQRDVAVKLVSDVRIGSEGRTRLLREARAAAKLNHPHIVTIFDAGELDDTSGSETGAAFIVMELVNGRTLNNPFPESLDSALAAARQVCLALDHAHQAGIVHRDIKPENILITPDGVVKLMDFGLAHTVASRMSMDGAFVGTVHYIAPEQAMGMEVDGRADLYALGVLLYEMTTGQLPFFADDPFSVITQHLHAPIVPPRAKNDAIPAWLNSLILNLMAKKPEDRPATAAAVIRSLDRPVVETGQAAGETPAETADLNVLDRIVRGRIVGREADLQELLQNWQQTLGGEGQFVLVSGEPGVGKSRLVRELVTRVGVSHRRAYVGECYQEGDVPYGPFAQILNRLVQDLPEESPPPDFVLEDLLTVAPALRLNFPSIIPSASVSGKSEQFRMMENIAGVIRMTTEQSPLLLVLEDLHWADDGTLAMLRHLVRAGRDMPLMILVTYRESDLDQTLPFQRILMDFTRERLGTRIKLSRLDEQATRSLLNALFGESTSSDLISAVFRETEGNPFFIEEVVKSLVEEGQIRFENGRWLRSTDEMLLIPQSIRVVIQQRLSKLPESSQEILNTAALIGRDFNYDLLSAAVDATEDTLIDELEEMDRAQLIEETGSEHGGTFRFVHALIPATVVEGISGLRRRRLHRNIAEAIQASDPEDYERLAQHYYESGNLLKSLEFSRKAAERARRLFSMAEAQKHIQRAVEITESLQDENTLLELLISLGEILELRGMSLAAVEAFQNALELVEDPDERINLQIRIGRSFTVIGDPRGLPILEEVRNILKADPKSSRRAAVLSLIARYYHYQSSHEKAAELLEEARVISEARNDAGVLINLYAFLAGTYQHMMKIDRSNDWANRVIALGEENGDPLAVAVGNEFLSENLNITGHYREAAGYAEIDLKIGKKYGALDRTAWALFSHTFSRFGLGKFQDTVEYGERGFELAQRIDEHRLKVWYIGLLAPAKFFLGNTREAIHLADDGLRQARDLGQSVLINHCINARILIHNQQREWDQAAELLEEARRAYRAGDNQSAFFFALENGIDTLIGLGRYEEAREFLAEAIERAQGWNQPYYDMRIESFEAILKLALGEFRTAAERFETSRQTMRDMGLRFLEGTASYHLAESCIGMGNDRQAAAEMAVALQCFEDCGAQPWIDQANHLLARLA